MEHQSNSLGLCNPMATDTEQNSILPRPEALGQAFQNRLGLLMSSYADGITFEKPRAVSKVEPPNGRRCHFILVHIVQCVKRLARLPGYGYTQAPNPLYAILKWSRVIRQCAAKWRNMRKAPKTYRPSDVF